MLVRAETLTEPASRVQITHHAGAVGDFSPVYIDDEFAGRPDSVIADGPLILTLALDRVVSQSGGGAVRSFEARLGAPVIPMDVLGVVPTGGGSRCGIRTAKRSSRPMLWFRNNGRGQAGAERNTRCLISS